MRAESNTPVNKRFLLTDARFSTTSINLWKSETQLRNKNQADPKNLEKYLQWQPSAKEIALFISSVYADLALPKSFSCLFDFQAPKQFVLTDMTMVQSIRENWLPVSSMDQGHKHTGIFAFKAQVPDIIFKLHEEEQKFSSRPKDALQLEKCQWEDYEEIKKRILTIQHLREKHGANWGDYYQEKK